MKPILILSLLLAAPAALAVDVEGYVYAVDGTPVAKASVTAGSQRATSDADGHFTVTSPADTVVPLEVRAETFPPARILALAGDPPLTITLGVNPNNGMPTAMTTSAVPLVRAAQKPAERDRVLTGVVRIGKRTLANAPVLIQAHGEGYTGPTIVISDEKGRYRASVAAGRYMVSIGEGLSPRLRPIREEQTVADLTKAREATADVELVAAPLITGRVLDANEKPVGRADVLIALAGRSTLDFFYQPVVRTLPNGRFAIPAPQFGDGERVEIVVTPPRHSPTRSKPFVLGQAKDTTIVLPKFEAVTLRVTDRAGKPLNDSFVAYATGDEVAAFGGNASMLLTPHLGRRRVRATNGEIALYLTTGDYEFAASAPRYQPKTESRAIARPLAFDVVLEAGHAITGRVRRGEVPVAGVQVMIRAGAVRRAENNVNTDEKGSFTFDALPRGTYAVHFFKHDELIDRTLTVDAPGEVDLDLPPTGTLTGRVVDRDTRGPVAQFMYSLEPLDSGDDARARERHMQRGGSGADGTFSATVPVGAYRIVAAATGFLPSEPVEVRVSDDAPATVEITLGRGASVSGRVTDEQGRPVLEANVMIVREAGEITRSSRSMTRVGPSAATTGEDGTFTITGVETGPAQLMVQARGYVLTRREIEVEAETRADVTLSRGLTVTGVVTLDGKPVAGASVDAVTSAMNAGHQSAQTDDRGRFTLEGLIAARYTIGANHLEHYAQVENVDTTQRRELVIELEGQGRGTVIGTVSGLPRGSGKLQRGTVFAQSTERGAEGTLDAAGNYRIENAPAGPIEIVAHVETLQGSRSTTRKRVELGAGQTLRVDLDLTPALVVTGRVTTGAAKPVARAHIVFNSEETGMVSAITREDGSYEAGLPAPGRYQIFANAEELMNRHYQTVREIRGSETFDIHLAEQTVEGIVVDAATGQPLAGALVTLVPKQAISTQMPAVSAETATDAGGRFSMIAAASGPHVLIASANGYAQRGQDVTAGGDTPLRARFELTPASELRVRVVDARNRTPLEAHLVVTDEKGGFLPVRAMRTADGTELVFSLAPGRYRLKAVTMGYPEKTVEVSAPGTATIEM